MNATELDRELRTTIARLELVSCGPTCNYNPDGGGGSGEGLPTGERHPPHEHYRHRLASIDRGLRRRLDAAEATGDAGQRSTEERDAHQWHHDARVDVLESARATLARLTGRTDEAPERKTAKLDTVAGVEEVVREEAPGKAADDLAAELKVSRFVVRRIYVTEGLDPHDGSLRDGASDTERRARAWAMFGDGRTQKQIAFTLGVNQATVSRWLRKAA